MTDSVIPNRPRKISRIVVLGGGTAGFLAAMALKRHLPESDVRMVRSTRMGVIGVGEGTIISIIPFLHQYLGLDTRTFHQRVRPSIKLGIKYLWGTRPFFHYTFSRQLSQPDPNLRYPRGYYCQESFEFADITSALMIHDRVCLKRIDGRPRFLASFAYHLENRSLVEYLESIADELSIPKIDDVVQDVELDENGVTALRLESGQRVEGDLFIDCSGFRSELLGKALGEEFVSFKSALFCDRAVVGGWPRSDEPYHPYTTAETMNAGWCWQIEHDEIINRGYVFSSDFLTDDQAETEYRRKNPIVEKTHVVKFPAGIYRRTWVKNVVAIGNSAGFVEPLEATAIGTICDSVSHVIRAIQASGGYLEPVQRDIYNRIFGENWEIIRDFLALHYKFNGRLNTPFWQAARNDVCLGNVQEIVDYYKTVGPDLRLLNYDLKRDFFSSEGYFVMLVGQQVPFRRKVDISSDSVAVWQAQQREWDQRAHNGMAMSECLADLRKNGLPGYVSAEGADDAGDLSRSGFDELKWQ